MTNTTLENITSQTTISLNQKYTHKVATPFLKWVGGKSQLLPELKKYVPKYFNKYIEPFIGGGALFFDLNPTKAVISDSNDELINAYTIVRDDVDELIDALREHEHDKTYFYEIRSKNPKYLSKIERAARLIYLNKTCFNGLYRVNKKGEFNVPFGSYSNPSICDVEKLKKASSALANTIIECGDYKTMLNKYANQGDFIYIDPPYHPISKFSDFKRYTKDFFYAKDQIDLRNMIEKLKNKGCFVVSSNSYCNFILELYQGFDINVVEAKRYINKIASRRNGTKEVIIL